MVVGTTLPSTYNTIQSYSHALHLPFILASSTRPGSRDHYHYDVSLTPPFVDAVIRTIAGIPRNHKVYYVYDNDDGKVWADLENVDCLELMYHRKDFYCVCFVSL